MLLKDASEAHEAVGGHISHCSDQTNNLVFLRGNSVFATSFRFLLYNTEDNPFQRKDVSSGAL